MECERGKHWSVKEDGTCSRCGRLVCKHYSLDSHAGYLRRRCGRLATKYGFCNQHQEDLEGLKRG